MRASRLLVASLFGLTLALPAEGWKGKVIGIADGDTITILHGGKPEKVRIAGIDCPERKQPFGEKAKLTTSRLVYGKVVDVHTQKKDRYGRTIADVLFASNRNLSHELLRNGFAWWYQSLAPKQLELGRLQWYAKSRRIGLWIDPAPIAPWNFRLKKKQQ